MVPSLRCESAPALRLDFNVLDRGREMYDVELYRKVRLACHQDGMSGWEAALHFGINRRTVAKMLKHFIPPGYQQSQLQASV